MKRKPYDENDLHDSKFGDPNATLEKDQYGDDPMYSQVQKRPNGEDASDRLDHHPGNEVCCNGDMINLIKSYFNAFPPNMFYFG